MKNLVLILVITICVLLVSCGKNAADAISANSVDTVDDEITITGSFIDSQVSGFTYTVGSANLLIFKNNIKNVIDLVLPRALAVNTTYDCYYNLNVSFSITALGHTLNKTYVCSDANTLESNLRRVLIESFDGDTLEKTVTVNGDLNAQLDFSGGFNYNSNYIVNYLDVMGAPCYAAYYFYNDGRVKVNKSKLISESILGNGNAEHCPNVALAYFHYRFKDGSLEFDTSMTNDFISTSGHYEKWELP